MATVPLPRLTASNQQAIAKANDPMGMEGRRSFASEMTKARAAGIKRWYREGGAFFLDWVKEHYRRWTGEPLNWDEPYAEEAYLLRGNPWIEKLMEEKGGQVGYSESMIALASFVLAVVRVSVGYGFEQERKMRDLTAPRIQPAFSHIQPIQHLLLRYKDALRREDTDSKDRKITVGAVPLTFFYTSTSSAKTSQERQAPASMTSFEAWVVIGDEVEAWPAGTLDIAMERQSACTMPTKPLRAGSTPGAEGGIVDAQVKGSKYLFQWRMICPHCQTAQFLHPFGNFLKAKDVELEDGSKERQFIDITGRPHDWFCRDQTDLESRTTTAYVGCIECEEQLTWEAIASGCFADNPHRSQEAVKADPDGLTLRQLCDRVLQERLPIYEWVALRLPRLASKLFEPVERIRKLTTTKNPADAIQQGLGVSVSVGMGKISLPRLLRCIGAPLPEELVKPDLVVMGVDQGTAANWSMVQHWYLPADEKDLEQQWLKAHVQVVWYGQIAGLEEVDDFVERYGIDLVGIDGEPEIQTAAAYARKHQPRKVKKGKVYLFDQVHLKGQEWKETVRISQKQKVKMYAMHRTWGLDAVRDRINRSLLHLPAGLVYEPKDPQNLLYHYLTSERMQGKWSEPEGEPDHFMHAHNFCEAAVHVSFFTKKGGGLSFSSMD